MSCAAARLGLQHCKRQLAEGAAGRHNPLCFTLQHATDRCYQSLVKRMCRSGVKPRGRTLEAGKVQIVAQPSNQLVDLCLRHGDPRKRSGPVTGHSPHVHRICRRKHHQQSLSAVKLDGNVLRAGHGGAYQALVVRKFGFDFLLVLDALGLKQGNACAHLIGYFRQW